MSEVYDRLKADFDQTFKLPSRGGSPELDYITGEQCISRLNEVLGFDGWSFEIKEHGHDQEADEIWVLGRLTVYVGDRVVIREQMGSQEVKRKRADNEILEIGFDLKGATTDALKKCASLIGVGLSLYAKGSKPTTQQRQHTVDTSVTTTTTDRMPSQAERDAYTRGLQQAAARGLDLGPYEVDGKTTRAELVELGRKLKAQLDAQSAQQPTLNGVS